MFRLERPSLGHQIRVRGGWCQWIHRTLQGDHLIYMKEIVVFIMYRSEVGGVDHVVLYINVIYQIIFTALFHGSHTFHSDSRMCGMPN